MNEKTTMTAFLRIMKFAAQEFGYDVFCAVEKDGVGYVAYSNEGSKAIRKLAEEANGFENLG